MEWKIGDLIALNKQDQATIYIINWKYGFEAEIKEANGKLKFKDQRIDTANFIKPSYAQLEKYIQNLNAEE